MILPLQDREWPQESELVVCTVVNVKDFVAFVSLDEYGGRPGLIPISEIATGWIKHIRDHVREGQKIVCKVLNVDRSRGHIDLSLKDVNEHQRRVKISKRLLVAESPTLTALANSLPLSRSATMASFISAPNMASWNLKKVRPGQAEKSLLLA